MGFAYTCVGVGWGYREDSWLGRQGVEQGEVGEVLEGRTEIPAERLD